MQHIYLVITTASESTYGNSYGSLTSFDSDGFSVAEGTDGTYPDAAFQPK